MDSIFDYLDALEDVLESSKAVPFSNRVSVDRDRIYEILDEIRMNLPSEIDKAQKIVADHDRIINDAKNKANSILDAANIQAEKLVEEHEIYKQAVEVGNEIIERNKKSAREFRVNAVEYADEVLAKAESAVRESMECITQNQREIDERLNNTLEIIYQNRQDLRVNNKKQ